ncbi:MAG TPA: sigma-70 family RNA polymerase sigma factor [Gemmata sp.]|nr:sigma-70 family RNA polymerase sigma factor [Gemmata sp.]
MEASRHAELHFITFAATAIRSISNEHLGGVAISVTPPFFVSTFVQFRRGLYAAHWAGRAQTPGGNMSSDRIADLFSACTTDTLAVSTKNTIRHRAKQIVRRLQLPRSDRSDVEQDISVHVWKRLGRFDPTKSDDHAAFVRMLVAHAVSTVLRDRARRCKRAPRSLEEALRRSVQLAAEPLDPRSTSWETETALAIDIEAVLTGLAPKHRRVAEALKSMTVAAAARHLGLSRSEVYRRLAALRTAFEAVGLVKFF